jgi:phosphatidylglycerol---prolipoprotein diacylglyceryl transferase
LPRAPVVPQIFPLRIIPGLIYLAGLIAYYLDNFSPFMVKFGPSFGIRWYGFSYLLAFFCGFLLLRWLAQHRYCALPAAKVGDFIALASLGVVAGGRLGYVLFYRPGQALADPLFILRVWDGGMSSHGGMIGLTLVTFFYARSQRISWLSLADNIAVVAPVGLFLGRCANFINGELYGRAATVAWAMQFPKEALDLPEIGARTLAAAHAARPTVDSLEAVIEHARTDPGLQSVLHQTLTPRHPSQIYEALLEGAVLFGCLWFLRVRTKQPRGMLAGLFLLLYALVRVVVEYFREPDAPLTGPFTRGQTLSVMLIIGGICFVAYAWRTKEYEEAQ